MFFEFIGAMCLVFVCLAALAAGAGYLLDEWNDRRYFRRQQQLADAARELGASLDQESRWIADHRAGLAVRAFGQTMIHHARVDGREARERWQQLCLEEGCPVERKALA